LVDAEHEESSPEAATLLINRLSCSLVGQTQLVRFTPGSQVATIYGQSEAMEEFRCNYGFNSSFAENFRSGALRFSGFDSAGELRVVELPAHRFFVATLFLPQMRSNVGHPHPLITAYLRAAR
jgi:CTP synthase (UTP-ammonia lyase)